MLSFVKALPKLVYAAEGRQHRAAPGGLPRITRKEDESGAVVPGRGQVDAERCALAHEEGVRHLNEDARAVARIDLAAAGAAVEEVLEHLEGLGDDGVRSAALDVHHEADAAGIVLVVRAVEPLSLGKPRRCRL